MRRVRAFLPLLRAVSLTALVASPGAAGTLYREDFGNSGEWSFGTGGETVEESGGNPGAFVRDRFVDTFAPQARTAVGVHSPFSGNYRTRAVTHLGIDIQIFAVDFSAGGRPLSVILTNDQDTPDNPFDDCSVYSIGSRLVPQPGQGWRGFTFPVPAASETLPAGWALLEESCQGFDPDEAWERIITDVDRVSFFFGDPTLFYIFQVWDVGLDSPRVLSVP